MKTGFRKLLLLLLFTLFFLRGEGYHIVGGDFTYRWIGGNNFEVTLTLYRDCSNPIASGFDDSIMVSVYDRVTNLIADSMVMAVSLVDSLQLTGLGCVPPPEVCLQYGVYINQITLSDNPNGYYIVWERCCRNNTITNITNPDQAGMAFYAEIADPALNNTSPVFKKIEIPLFCLDQFFRFSFEATDADGDQLVYELIEPLDGGHTSQSQPGPHSYINITSTPFAPLSAPYTTTTWAPGYSLSNICGSALPLTIDTLTGEIEVQPDLLGIYAMAVLVKEYRNGIYIGSIRREIEFTVINCGNNAAPQIPPQYSGVADIHLYATDTLDIRMNVIDHNGDSIFILVDGNIFSNSSQLAIDPPYALSPDTSGIDTVATYITWRTGCQHINDSSYKVMLEASDNGCPLFLTDLGQINIYIEEPPLIAKSNLVCIDMINDSILSITRISDTAYDEQYFSHFLLYRSVNGGAFLPYKTIYEIDPVLIYDSLAYMNKDNDYCYVLASFNVCNREGEWSDTLCSVSHINTHRNYIERVSVIDQNSIEISWEPFNDGPYAVYTLYRMEADSSLQFYQTFTSYTAFSWTDHLAETNDQSYCYAMVNEDVCGNISDTSLIACSILLKGEADYYLNRLNWSEYINFKGGVKEYEVLRQPLSASAFSNIASVAEGELLLNDRDMNRDNGIFRYKIQAVEGPGGRNAKAFSNEVELHQQPILFLPSAFTPNNDGVNDNYLSESSFVTEFSMVIYNRWGDAVFQTENIAQAWDGSLKNKPAPTGVYFYKILFRGYDDPSPTELTGSITLIR
jgi:gliding motility-associated-like protein